MRRSTATSWRLSLRPSDISNKGSLLVCDMRINLPVLLMWLFAIHLAGGCLRYRSVAAANVKDVGSIVHTRYKYRPSWSHDKERNGNGDVLRERMKQYQPEVFADEGIPFTISDRCESYENWGCWKIDRFKNPMEFGSKRTVYAFTFSLVPLFNGTEFIGSEEIRVLNNQDTLTSFRMYTRQDNAFSFLTPLPFLLYGDFPDMKGCGNGVVRSKNGYEFTSSEYKFEHSHPEGDEVLAYALAVKLKELEDMGKITYATFQSAAYMRTQRAETIANSISRKKTSTNPLGSVSVTSSQIQRPLYKIISLCRDESCDFAYAFVLELNGEPSIQTFFGIQGIFAHEVRNAYKMEYPNADVSTLRIAVQPQLVSGRIQGRAVVLTIVPVSLSYDVTTRRGRLSVKFNAGQMAEARAWIRKNIKTLARDKNIALVTGQLPPAATYYSLGEKIDGDVMEVEFKTE